MSDSQITWRNVNSETKDASGAYFNLANTLQNIGNGLSGALGNYNLAQKANTDIVAKSLAAQATTKEEVDAVQAAVLGKVPIDQLSPQAIGSFGARNAELDQNAANQANIILSQAKTKEAEGSLKHLTAQTEDIPKARATADANRALQAKQLEAQIESAKASTDLSSKQKEIIIAEHQLKLKQLGLEGERQNKIFEREDNKYIREEDERKYGLNLGAGTAEFMYNANTYKSYEEAKADVGIISKKYGLRSQDTYALLTEAGNKFGITPVYADIAKLPQVSNDMSDDEAFSGDISPSSSAAPTTPSGIPSYGSAEPTTPATLPSKPMTSMDAILSDATNYSGVSNPIPNSDPTAPVSSMGMILDRARNYSPDTTTPPKVNLAGVKVLNNSIVPGIEDMPIKISNTETARFGDIQSKKRSSELDNGGEVDLGTQYGMFVGYNSIKSNALRITGGNDTFHQENRKGSEHVKGRAFDITVKAGSSYQDALNNVRQSYIDAGLSPNDFTVNHETSKTKGATGEHIHVEFKDSGLSKLKSKLGDATNVSPAINPDDVVNAVNPNANKPAPTVVDPSYLQSSQLTDPAISITSKMGYITDNLLPNAEANVAKVKELNDINTLNTAPFAEVKNPVHPAEYTTLLMSKISGTLNIPEGSAEDISNKAQEMYNHFKQNGKLVSYPVIYAALSEAISADTNIANLSWYYKSDSDESIESRINQHLQSEKSTSQDVKKYISNVDKLSGYKATLDSLMTDMRTLAQVAKTKPLPQATQRLSAVREKVNKVLAAIKVQSDIVNNSTPALLTEFNKASSGSVSKVTGQTKPPPKSPKPNEAVYDQTDDQPDYGVSPVAEKW